ncbi:MAG: glycosyltransferase family 4 protein [Phycisphaerae bacterium]|jgi:glycosyltransferase involved in cell wall biosynthesis
MDFEIVCCVALGDAQVYHHLMPISLHPVVTKIWIIRHKNVQTGNIPKAELLKVSRFKPLRFIQMYRLSRKLAQRKEVKAFVSFNPIPYGIISYLGARKFNKPVHFGFIGADWYRMSKAKGWNFLQKILRNGSFFTATGESMKNEMTEYGYEREKISVLPHSIDINKFKVSELKTIKYDCLYVGQLIHRKRVDIILKAFAEVLKQNPGRRLCIVGGGHLSGELKSLTKKLNIEGNVDFAGHTNDVSMYFSQSKIFVMASYMEGFPFAMVEAMCSGLVPVTTPVGTITDIVKHNEMGLIYKQNDIAGLGKCIDKLINDSAIYTRIRNNLIMTRNNFSYESALTVWDKWFRQLN